jgi:flagellar motor switch protein FliM
MSDTREAAAPPRPYHLFSDHSPARTRMPTLEPTLGRINDRFARLLRATLLQHLRRGIEVGPGPIELVRHRELLERLGTPTYMTMISMKPLRGTIVIVLDVPLVIGIVESRFGGSGRFPVATANREFTPFELKSMRRVMEATLEQLVIAWEPFGKFEADIIRLETEPQFAGFATAEEMIVVSPFEVKVDQGHGQLLACIPYSSIEQLISGIVEDSVDHDQRWSEALKRTVSQATITLQVELGKIPISLGELASLRPGAVFEMERPEILTVEAGGIPLFRGRWGRHGRKLGVRIEERVMPVAEAIAAVRPGGRKDGRGDD